MKMARDERELKQRCRMRDFEMKLYKAGTKRGLCFVQGVE